MAEPSDFETAIAHTGFGRFNIMLMAAAFVSIVAFLWDTTVTAYIIPLAQCDLNLSNLDKGALNAISYAGLISSSLLWGPISDTICRIKLLRVVLFIDGIIAFCSAFSTSLWMLLPLRYLVGFLTCPALPLTMTIVTEFHGMKYRSRCIMAVGFYCGAAQVLLPAIGLAMLTKTWEYEAGVMKLHPWNTFVMLCSLPSLLVCLVYSIFPQTPKFLMSQGRNEEAIAVMRKIYATNKGADPDSFPVECLVEEVPESHYSPAHGTPSIKVLFTRVFAGCRQLPSHFSMEYLRYTVLVLFIQGCTLLSLNTVRLWLPQLFTALEEFYELQRLNGTSTPVYMCDALMAHWLHENESLPATVFTFTMEEEDICKPSVKNKIIYVNSMIMCSISAVVVALSSILVRLWDYKQVIISCCMLGSVFCVSSLWSMSWTATVAIFTTYLSAVNIVCISVIGVVATMFPTKLRATAVSLTMMIGYITTVIGNVLFPLLMELGCEVPFYMFAACHFVSGLVSFALPYTKGHALT